MNIIELAKQAGLTVGTNISGVTLVGSPSTHGLAHISIDEMERFAQLVRNQALEEAAEACQQYARNQLADETPIAYVYGARECAESILWLRNKT